MLSRGYFGGDLPTWALLFEIVVAGLVVILSGARLAKLGDVLADQFGLGGAWIGALLLATVTSLPEVVSSATAAWVGQPDMAFAAIYGSCSFNIVLIVLLNAIIGGGSILYGKGRLHVLNASFGIVMIALSLLCVLLVGKKQGDPGLAQTIEVSLVVLIAFTYLACMRMTFRTEREVSPPSAEPRFAPAGKSALIPKVLAVSVILVVSAWWMARTGDVLAKHEIKLIGGPLGATFVGVLFIAVATSLPEVATSVSAVRLGRLDMALGNIFGSNMFNIFVIPITKIASSLSGDTLLMGGPEFSTDQNVIAGLLPILLTGVVVGGMSYQSDRRLLNRIGWDSMLIAAIYVVGMYFLLA